MDYNYTMWRASGKIVVSPVRNVMLHKYPYSHKNKLFYCFYRNSLPKQLSGKVNYLPKHLEQEKLNFANLYLLASSAKSVM